MKELKGYFITGTDTNVGKTVAATWLMHRHDADYWKPIQSGLEGETDQETVQRLTGFPENRFHPSTYVFKAPMSPHEAARRESVVIDLAHFTPPETTRPLIVEGAGGLLVPLNEHHYMIDLIQRLRLPTVLVARTALGTINHTLLSLSCLRSCHLSIAGVILNGPAHPSNRHAIETYGQVKILAEIPHFNPLTQKQLLHLP